MLLGGPAAHVGANLGKQTQGAVGPDGVELGEIRHTTVVSSSEGTHLPGRRKGLA